MRNPLSICLIILSSIVPAFAQSSADADAEAAYIRAINERAAKIVAGLGLTNDATAAQAQEIIAAQYRSLRTIHDARDARNKAAKQNSNDDTFASALAVKAAQRDAKGRLDALHAEFLGKLSRHLNPAQVEGVKDGMTYGVLNITYDVYLRMCPDLSDEQRARIKSWLVEARELAMDQGTASEKHAVFGKYKGRINNYLSSAGYDLKKAEQNLRK
jgi:hypothetical protein